MNADVELKFAAAGEPMLAVPHVPGLQVKGCNSSGLVLGLLRLPGFQTCSRCLGFQQHCQLQLSLAMSCMAAQIRFMLIVKLVASSACRTAHNMFWPVECVLFVLHGNHGGIDSHSC
jgi:hypothetical protein